MKALFRLGFHDAIEGVVRAEVECTFHQGWDAVAGVFDFALSDHGKIALRVAIDDHGRHVSEEVKGIVVEIRRGVAARIEHFFVFDDSPSLSIEAGQVVIKKLEDMASVGEHADGVGEDAVIRQFCDGPHEGSGVRFDGENAVVLAIDEDASAAVYSRGTHAELGALLENIYGPELFSGARVPSRDIRVGGQHHHGGAFG